MLKALDLFSGIGGNSLALFDVAETVAYCEFDKHAQAVLKTRMQDGLLKTVPIFEDVKSLSKKDLPYLDMIVAGFPCQDIYVAGKGAGIIEGNRSGLFFEIMRLTDECRPKFLFLENVPAIRTRGLDIVLQELTKRRYDCRWTMLSAANVGAKHKRERWFALAVRRDSECANPEHTGRDVAEIQGSPGQTICDNQKGQNCARESSGMDSQGNVADTDERRLSTKGTELSTTRASGDCAAVSDSSIQRLQRSSSSKNPSGQGKKTKQLTTGCNQSDLDWTIEPRLGRMVDGLSDRLDESLSSHLGSYYWKEEPQGIPRVTQEKEQRVERIKRLGNAVVPLQARTAFFYLMGWD